MLVTISNSNPDLRSKSKGHSRWEGDPQALAEELRKALRGEVQFDSGTRALYATDASNYRQVPIGVVTPRDIDDVIATVAISRQFNAPLLSRGGGTSLAGECCNAAVVMDMTRYLNRVLEIDAVAKKARVQPGCVLDDLRHRANRFGLTFGPDPATHSHCTLGGMCGNNSCGMHAQMAGRTSDNIHELDILTYEGIRMRVGETSEAQLAAHILRGGRTAEIYRRLRDLRHRYADLILARFPQIPRRISGYNLDELLPEKGFQVARALAGTEGTCVTYLEIVADLVYNPPKRALLVLGYPDVFQAGDDIPEVVAQKPIACEGIDERLIGYMEKKHLNVRDLVLLPEGKGWLMVEFGGETRREAEDHALRLMRELKKRKNPPSMKLYDDARQEQKLWEVRESGLGATAVVPGEPDNWPGWEDSAVPPDRVGDYLRDLKKLFEEHGLDNPSLYGHFGQGCIHCRIPFNLKSHHGLEQYRSFMDAATDLVVSYGGSLSGEHGDGQSRAEYLYKMYGPELVQAFGEFKAIWDPQGKMNPGKVVHPYRIDQNLRLGTDYEPKEPATHFAFPDDHFSLAKATLRCVGVGNCRREQGGTMCPSYMVTREEKHSTRGRAHLLNEMLRGNPLRDEWRSEPVREALDLCLSCKGCKGDCPVNVDMATYKSEFLSHYYAGRLRPRTQYVSGLIHIWSRLAATMPASANFFTQTPGLSAIAKWAAGYHPNRHMPKFAGRTFKQSLRGRRPKHPNGPRVILWADTFNDHFTPQVAQAAMDVLEDAGFRVLVPKHDVCCGRPLYDYGMLGIAKSWLLKILQVLREEIRAGTPVVGLEPSCISVFREEMPNLLHGDEDAARLKDQSFLLSEFLSQQDGYAPPALKGKAIVHGHCHHKSVLHWDSEVSLLQRAGMTINVLDSGCCGMAGAFGYEKDHYDVSVACGERVLLPEVRDAPADWLILADGFSCREQIEQETERHALHLAQVLQLALKQGPKLHGNILDIERRSSEVPDAGIPFGVLAGAGGAIAAAIYLMVRERS